MFFESDDINFLYKKLAYKLLTNGLLTAPRNIKIKELINVNCVLENPCNNVITIPGVETNLNYAKKEFEWYCSATNKINFDPLIKKIWNKYSLDGETVKSGYGLRIGQQWEFIKELLYRDNDSRQCVLNLNEIEDKKTLYPDFPCTMFLQFFIRNKKLILIANMRSNDIFYGFRNDVYCFTELQNKMMCELNNEYDLKLTLGQYFHNVGSLHVYEPEWKKLSCII